MNICLRHWRVATLADISDRLGAVPLGLDVARLTHFGRQAAVSPAPRRLRTGQVVLASRKLRDDRSKPFPFLSVELCIFARFLDLLLESCNGLRCFHLLPLASLSESRTCTSISTSLLIRDTGSSLHVNRKAHISLARLECHHLERTLTRARADRSLVGVGDVRGRNVRRHAQSSTSSVCVRDCKVTRHGHIARRRGLIVSRVVGTGAATVTLSRARVRTSGPCKMASLEKAWVAMTNPRMGRKRRNTCSTRLNSIKSRSRRCRKRDLVGIHVSVGRVEMRKTNRPAKRRLGSQHSPGCLMEGFSQKRECCSCLSMGSRSKRGESRCMLLRGINLVRLPSTQVRCRCFIWNRIEN